MKKKNYVSFNLSPSPSQKKNKNSMLFSKNNNFYFYIICIELTCWTACRRCENISSTTLLWPEKNVFFSSLIWSSPQKSYYVNTCTMYDVQVLKYKYKGGCKIKMFPIRSRFFPSPFVIAKLPSNISFRSSLPKSTRIPSPSNKFFFPGLAEPNSDPRIGWSNNGKNPLIGLSCFKLVCWNTFSNLLLA